MIFMSILQFNVYFLKLPWFLSKTLILDLRAYNCKMRKKHKL